MHPAHCKSLAPKLDPGKAATYFVARKRQNAYEQQAIPRCPTPFVRVNAMLNRDESETPRSTNPVPDNPGVIELASHRSLFGTRLDDISGKLAQDSPQMPAEPVNGRES